MKNISNISILGYTPSPVAAQAYAITGFVATGLIASSAAFGAFLYGCIAAVVVVPAGVAAASAICVTDLACKGAAIIGEKAKAKFTKKDSATTKVEPETVPFVAAPVSA